MVLVGRQLDPFALAAEQAFINVNGGSPPITPELARLTQNALECLVAMHNSPGEPEQFEAIMRAAIEGDAT